jgi:5-methylcytosine-specific restriction endonuclease McrA
MILDVHAGLVDFGYNLGNEIRVPERCANSLRRDTGAVTPMCAKHTPTPENSAILNGHGLREPILLSVRNHVLNRDNLSCAYCGDLATDCDHVIPASYGGKSTPDNLVACCRWCNAKLSNRYFEDGVDGKKAYIREHFQRKFRKVRRQVSICADCGNVFQPNKRPATHVLCATCVRIDNDVFEIRGRLHRGASLVTVADEYGVVPEVLSDRVFGTNYRREREKSITTEEMQEFIRGIREHRGEYTA